MKNTPCSPNDANGAAGFPQKFAFSRQGIIATAHEVATLAGVNILAEGGNAFDAAVAAAFTLGVCEPMSSGLGGQTMMLINCASENNVIAIDGSSRAPNRANLELLSKAEMRRGHRATTVPSTPAVLEYIRQKYGTMPLKRLLVPAIEAAENGYRVSKLQHDLMARCHKQLSINTGGHLFLKENAKAYSEGDVFKQPVLAETMRRLAEKGIEDFYAGEIADTIVKDMEKNDGFIRHDDLARIPWPIERRPLTVKYRHRRVMTFPPPGAGRALVEMINILGRFSAEELNINKPRGAVILAKTIQQAQRDRRDRPCDPSFYPQITDEEILGPKYTRSVVSGIKRNALLSGETSHLSAIDKWGNVVALTQSIEKVFGAYSASEKLGFLYNNYMSAFEYQDISHPYYLRPNAAPWASVAPTIVFQGSHPWLALGSPGSERIAPSIMQVLLRMEKQSPMDAVFAPRLHSSLDGEVSIEASRMRSDIIPALEKAGFSVKVQPPFAFYLGCVQLAMRTRHGYIGVADMRRDGAAGGP